MCISGSMPQSLFAARPAARRTANTKRPRPQQQPATRRQSAVSSWCVPAGKEKLESVRRMVRAARTHQGGAPAAFLFQEYCLVAGNISRQCNIKILGIKIPSMTTRHHRLHKPAHKVMYCQYIPSSAWKNTSPRPRRAQRGQRERAQGEGAPPCRSMAAAVHYKNVALATRSNARCAGVPHSVLPR